MNLNIEAERARRQMTKETLSKSLGITTKTYNNYIKGDTPIPSNVLLDMASMFGCTTDYLLGLEKIRRDVISRPARRVRKERVSK